MGDEHSGGLFVSELLARELLARELLTRELLTWELLSHEKQLSKHVSGFRDCRGWPTDKLLKCLESVILVNVGQACINLKSAHDLGLLLEISRAGKICEEISIGIEERSAEIQDSSSRRSRRSCRDCIPGFASGQL